MENQKKATRALAGGGKSLPIYFPKLSQDPPQTPPKPFKIEPKSNPGASKSPFGERSEYKPQKRRPIVALEAPRASKPFPKPYQHLPQTLPKSIKKHKRKKQCFSKRICHVFLRFWPRKPPNFQRNFIIF